MFFSVIGTVFETIRMRTRKNRLIMKTQILATVLILFFVWSCQKTKTFYSNNPGAPEQLHNRTVGASANEMLSAATYTSMKIEIQYMPGYAPDAAAVNHLQNVLNTYLNKPGGITVVTKEIPASSLQTLSIDAVLNIERNNRTVFTNGSQIGLYALYTNGYYTDNQVLGAAYRNTSIVVFGKNIHDNSGGIGQANRTKLEATVLEHEFGHLLGLVDIGSPMQTNHKDPSHGSHCNNNSCLMYYASDTRDILGILITGNIPAFDANCIADMRANGGK